MDKSLSQTLGCYSGYNRYKTFRVNVITADEKDLSYDSNLIRTGLRSLRVPLSDFEKIGTVRWTK